MTSLGILSVLKTQRAIYLIALPCFALLAMIVAASHKPQIGGHRSFDEYKGPSTETYPVIIDIANTRFKFPRNYIDHAANENGWTVFLVGEAQGQWGLTAENSWLSGELAGSDRAPAIIRAEVAMGTPFRDTAHWQSELQKQKATSEECGLPSYHFGGWSSYVVTGIPKPVFITCFDPNGGDRTCDMLFDYGNNVGASVRFNRVNLCRWKMIQDSVDGMLTAHISGAAR